MPVFIGVVRDFSLRSSWLSTAIFGGAVKGCFYVAPGREAPPLFLMKGLIVKKVAGVNTLLVGQADGRNIRRTFRKANELGNVVRAEDIDFVAMELQEFAQTILIPKPTPAIFFHHGLIESQTRRAVGFFDIHFAFIKISVARIEQPSFGPLYGDTCMA